MRAALLAFVLLVAGCSPPPLAPELELPLSRRAVVEFGGGWEPDREDRRELLRLLDLAERAFLHLDPGAPPSIRRVVLWRRWKLPRSTWAGTGLSSNLQLRGLCKLGHVFGAEIHLATGGPYPMSAAPHELRHAKRGDLDHELPGWSLYHRAGRGVSLVP